MRPSSVAQSLTMALLTTTAITPLLGASPVAAQNLPTGASIAYGSVGFQRSSGTLTINQGSQNAVVNYNSFSIGRRNTVNINQPNSTSMLLNRVTGTTPSTIAGRLNANGQVYLINPNGVAITKTGVVKVGGGFVASSLGMSDSDFLKGGKKYLRGSGASAAVTNAGTITIGRGGYAALVGGEVKNAGTIAVPMGKVALGSGEMATLDVSGDGFLQVALPTTSSGKGALVANSGSIEAAGGTVMLDAATARAAARNAVNISGSIDAHSIAGHNGSIVIGGGAGGTINVSGTLDVSGRGRTAGGVRRGDRAPGEGGGHDRRLRPHRRRGHARRKRRHHHHGHGESRGTARQRRRRDRHRAQDRAERRHGGRVRRDRRRNGQRRRRCAWCGAAAQRRQRHDRPDERRHCRCQEERQRRQRRCVVGTEHFVRRADLGQGRRAGRRRRRGRGIEPRRARLHRPRHAHGAAWRDGHAAARPL